MEKEILLRACNEIPVESLALLLEQGKISLFELENNLDPEKYNALKLTVQLKEAEEQKRAEANRIAGAKQGIIDRLFNNSIKANEIKNLLSQGNLNYGDLSQAGLSQQILDSIRFYCNEDRVTVFKRIDELPPLASDSTDVYFVGLGGSGKSTMLAGMSYYANRAGLTVADGHNQAGIKYQGQLITGLKGGILPRATASGSYNYVTLSLLDDKEKAHPFNIVEVPGELYHNIYNQETQDEEHKFMRYVKNQNRKILIFTIDPDISVRSKELDQSVIYPNILNIFQKNGVLEQTDAIYLVVNKFDLIRDSGTYSGNEAEKALAYLQDEFKSLITNCQHARSQTKSQFKIKVSPFSIGKIRFDEILESFDEKYSKELIENLSADSFKKTNQKFRKFN